MNILLAYQNNLCRSFLQNTLSEREQLFSISVAGSVEEIKKIVSGTQKFNLIALDINLPDILIENSLAEIKNMLGYQTAFALIGPHYSFDEFQRYQKLNLFGYLPYSLSPEALVGALRIMVAGEIYFPTIMDNEAQVSSKDYFTKWLTNREKEVLKGLLNGESNKEMARTHDLSEVTIKHHLKSLRSKLGAKNRTHAVCRAIELDLANETPIPNSTMASLASVA
ncbi:response regulator transcription factor [Alphaproteobacteria bacterium]|nr:response regulator transcription factor [Alphaproteobacteria bacterium]